MTIARILRKKGRHTPSIALHATISKAIDALAFDDVGALVVSSDGIHIEGIISERDVVRGIQRFGATVLDHAVREHMTEKVITCTANDLVLDVMSKMNLKRIRHIPVVDQNKFVGIINIRDVLKHRLEEVQHDAEGMLDYIAHA